MAEVDELSFTGLQTKDNTTLVSDLQTGFIDIYSQGSEELNFDSNTPDGQLIQLLAFAGSTIREMITEVYNSCDPDKCVGSIQDNRYQINYLTRKEGSYSIQNIAVTTNQTVELQGLDATYDSPSSSAFTVSDNNGNIWYLLDTTTVYSGTSLLPFRAKEKGAIVPTIGTITNMVTIIPGVISVINNVGATSIGVEEESDSDFRIRREISTAKSAKSNTDTMLAELLELDDVVDVNIHENKTNSTDSTGTYAHYIWVIVEGGSNEDIAEIIYANSSGAGTRGSVKVSLTSESQQPITINFDRETVVPLYIKFDIKPIGLSTEINVSGIKGYIAENLTYNIGEDVETSKVTQVCSDAMLVDGGNGYALDVQVSTGGSASASIGASTGITAATVDTVAFQYMVQDTAGTYEFDYSGGEWSLSSDVVDLTDYGIAYTGTAVNGDKITITYTASTWTDFLAASTIADKYTTDVNKIYTTML